MPHLAIISGPLIRESMNGSYHSLFFFPFYSLLQNEMRVLQPSTTPVDASLSLRQFQFASVILEVHNNTFPGLALLGNLKPNPENCSLVLDYILFSLLTHVSGLIQGVFGKITSGLKFIQESKYFGIKIESNCLTTNILQALTVVQ
jgi:hypothetical protein